jgi:hypothetical protein
MVAQSLHRLLGDFRLTASDGGLDQLGQRPPGSGDSLHFVGGLFCRSQGICVVAKTVAEDRPCPRGVLDSLSDAVLSGLLALDAMSANASGPPRYAACVRPQAEYHPIPVASLTASYSATIAVAAAKSPHHAAINASTVQGDGQRGERAGDPGETDVLDGQRIPALPIP